MADRHRRAQVAPGRLAHVIEQDRSRRGTIDRGIRVDGQVGPRCALEPGERLCGERQVTRRISVMALVAALVLVAAWFLLLWSPKGGELADARTRKRAAEQKVNELQVKLDRLKDAEKREPELDAQRDRLASAVPEKPEVAQFLLEANDAA